MSNITLRDHFAGLAMQGLLAGDTEQGLSQIRIADWSYNQADAMIAERNKNHKESHEELLCQGEPV